MDTEENNKIQHAIRNGHPETDEGPYYHEPWWEAYKGSVKGKLGGGVIGAMVGAVVGLAAAAILASASVIPIATGFAVAAAFSAAGMIYGAHEFSDVGRVTGAVAAAHEKSESRMKSFENGKFAELKKEISDLKSLITGKKAPTAALAAESANPVVAENGNGHSRDYRTTHCDEHCPPQKRQWVFWKIAAIGAVIGIAAGALLAAGGVSEHLLGMLGHAGETISKGATYLASITTMGLFGASFGLNRDTFREVFDKTDLAFKGIIKNGKTREKQLETAQEPTKSEPPITTIVYDSYANYPASDTYHRDKVLASAKQALLSMDHTKSVPH